jgi:ribosomal protein S19
MNKIKENLPRLTAPRDKTIDRLFLRKRRIYRVYAGSIKNVQIVHINNDMLKHKMGEFTITKRLGRRIHNSAKNQKKKKK